MFPGLDYAPTQSFTSSTALGSYHLASWSGRMFDWDTGNIAHIAEHGVSPDEAEEVVLNNPLDLDYRVEDGEIRIRQVGETSEGRILAVATTERGELIRVVTAYPASPFLRSTYRKYKEMWLYGKAGST